MSPSACIPCSLPDRDTACDAFSVARAFVSEGDGFVSNGRRDRSGVIRTGGSDGAASVRVGVPSGASRAT